MFNFLGDRIGENRKISFMFYQLSRIARARLAFYTKSENGKRGGKNNKIVFFSYTRKLTKVDEGLKLKRISVSTNNIFKKLELPDFFPTPLFYDTLDSCALSTKIHTLYAYPQNFLERGFNLQVDK